jgi:ribosomal subunit interface protein
MQTTITARHCTINDELRERAEAVLARLAAIASRPQDGAIVFDMEANLSSAEIRLHVSEGSVFIARGEGGDHRTALDRAEEKVRRQIEKHSGHPQRARAVEKDQG